MLCRYFVVGVATVAAMILLAAGASAQPFPNPMVFFVAKGKPDACGPGCSEWIAADGSLDAPGVGQRLRTLLDSLQGRDMPIFFNSYGGLIGEARVVGRLLRERRISAGVGRTVPEECQDRNAAEKPCRRIMQSGRELKAELRTDGATCSSACVYAFVGASRRRARASASMPFCERMKRCARQGSQASSWIAG